MVTPYRLKLRESEGIFEIHVGEKSAAKNHIWALNAQNGRKTPKTGNIQNPLFLSTLLQTMVLANFYCIWMTLAALLFV